MKKIATAKTAKTTATTKTAVTEKVCTVCGKVLPIDAFRTHKSGFVLNQCKECERIAGKEFAKKLKAFKDLKTQPLKFQIECQPNLPSNYSFANSARAKAKKGNPTAPVAKTAAPATFNVTTKNGKSYEVSSTPISGGRKIVSTASDKVLFVAPGVTRDEARAIYATYAKVSYTGISASLVD